ncbi:MAG: NnrS family protein [Methylococcales bacterium]|jgi:uncharacterized protein involved in response to NO|nr:NnrS family protein [Methylococcales bacterium]MBT7408805.1 NnrS family protein [Methylococcales bacterium]
MNNINTTIQNQTPAILSLGFRPFFLLACLFAIISMMIWSGFLNFSLPVKFNGINPVYWHAHEMVYGYSLAVIAGFLLTAIKNWTGVQTLYGKPLLILCGLWITSRLLYLLETPYSIYINLIIENIFILGLTIAISQPIIKVKQWKQIPVISKIIIFLIGNIIYGLGLINVLEQGEKWGIYIGLYTVLALLFMMARRVIPFFIENAADCPVKLKNWKWLDIASLVFFLAFSILDIFFTAPVLLAIVTTALVILHSIRLAGWYTHELWKKPLSWVLYIAYSFIVFGFFLKLISLTTDLNPYLSIHAFSFGGIGVITVGMMTRVSLGHTGRNVFQPPRILPIIFALMIIGSIFRVILPIISTPNIHLWLIFSQGFWIISFLLLLFHLLPMLSQPRIDEK